MLGQCGRLCYCSTTFASPLWGSVRLPCLIDIMPGRTLALANEIWGEMIYVTLEQKSQN